MIYDVAVIGAGVTGSMTARELMKYKLSVCLLEKADDVCAGSSKANSAIVHAGFDAENGTLKARLNVKGCELMPKVCKELDVHYKNTGSLVVSFSEEDDRALDTLYQRGVTNGVEGMKILSGDELFAVEPNLSKEARAALYAPTAGIVCPYELTIAAAENAVDNGAEVKLGFEVTSICENGDLYEISDGKETVTARYVVNAAGLYSDVIARLTGDCDFEIIPRKGEYMLYDKSCDGFVRTVLFSAPTKEGKGVLVAPTVDRNILVGPNAVRTVKEDTATTSEGLSEIAKNASRLVSLPLPSRKTVTSFAGVRPTPTGGDFVIKKSAHMKGVLHLAGIESPGLASSPATAAYAAELLGEMGLKLEINESFNPHRQRVVRFREMSDAERAELIKENPAYAKIICRCETVTEGEIIDAIRRPLGARTVDGVKRRARAGLGRCQGGFCMPRVAEILSRELGIPMTEITKDGKGSDLLVGKTKEEK